MPIEPVERYKQLLEKEPQENDQYVLVDVKWFKHWKHFIETDPKEEQISPPGRLDFTGLTAPDTENHPDGPQLRPDAVEGNDYTFIPFELYKDLKEKYGQIGKEIVRKAIPNQTEGYQMIIETHLVPLRLCKSQTERGQAIQIYRSRRTKVKQLENEVCRRLDLPTESGYRLMASSNEEGTTWERVDFLSNDVLADISLVKNAFITCESGSMVVRQNSAFLSSNNSMYTPGLCGLSNLGNTCFMNSALQCMSNVPALTRYFYRKEYSEHINRENPLGMKGDVADAYAELIANMWSGKTNYYAPKILKSSVARYAPQFSGFNQQDSQEFMSFLLDGLHEDLNMVKKKPYVEKQDDDGKMSDQALADEHWGYYLKRNQSKIQDIFHGQIKSIVHCLTCETEARTFDPICFLSLPLPEKKKMRVFKIEYVRLNGEVKIYYLKSNEHGRVKNLVEDFCNRFQKKVKNEHEAKVERMEVDPFNPDDDEEEEEDLTQAEGYDGHRPKADHILAAEVYNYRIHTQFRDDSLLSNILERDRIVFYETSYSLKKEHDDFILMPCVLRSTGYSRQNFGLPFYISIPRKGCTGQHIQTSLEKIITNFLPLSEFEGSTKPVYTPMLSINDYYDKKTKTVASMLNDSIDFGRTNISLIVDVDAAAVDKYEEIERSRNSKSEQNNIKSRSEKKETAVTLLDCFKHFTTKETLSDNDLWFCPKCKELKRATKKIDLWRLPQVLIVQLKRFNYTRYWRDKIDLHVDCPIEELDLSRFIANRDHPTNAKYELIAISNHMGGLGGGHYTAYAKNDIDKKWHSFDDGYVSSIEQDRLIGKSAYVLIYQQKGATAAVPDKRPGSSQKAASNN